MAQICGLNGISIGPHCSYTFKRQGEEDGNSGVGRKFIHRDTASTHRLSKT